MPLSANRKPHDDSKPIPFKHLRAPESALPDLAHEAGQPAAARDGPQEDQERHPLHHGREEDSSDESGEEPDLRAVAHRLGRHAGRRSDDGGQSWRKAHDGFIDDFVFSYGYYFGEIRVSPHDEDRLYLLTNARCEAAIPLYEPVGFQHDADILARFRTRYARADVAMRYAPNPLGAPGS